MLKALRCAAVALLLAIGLGLAVPGTAYADSFGDAICSQDSHDPSSRLRQPGCDVIAGTSGHGGHSTHGAEKGGGNDDAAGGGSGFDARLRIGGVLPEMLARQARARLQLPGVLMRLNPPGVQLVNLPIWLTLDRSSWTVRSATASVPGVSVTATARPVQVTWSMGDGGSVVCKGPGTAWRPGTDPMASSPDCGYTYRRSSAGAAGGRFTVAVTVSWVVTWVGAGQAGTIPGLSTTGTVRVAVQESQAVIS